MLKVIVLINGPLQVAWVMQAEPHEWISALIKEISKI